MKRVTNRVFLVFTLIMIMSWVLPVIRVNGGYQMLLLDDAGSSAGSWRNVVNGVATTTSLENGPSSGNPGSFYYFKNASSGTREMSEATIERDVMFNADQKRISSFNQLQVDFTMNYYGWSDSNDRYKVSLYSILEGGKQGPSFYASNYGYTKKSWEYLGVTDLIIPKNVIGIRIRIYADRESGDDLDIYLDNIRLYLYDEIQPVMTGATVTEIRDSKNDVVPLKKDEITGNYLTNWVNNGDTIYGKIEFNESVTIRSGIHTNIINEYGHEIYADITRDNKTFLTSHEYNIPLDYKDRMRAGDSTVKFLYGPDGFGPFDVPVLDLGGNQGQSDVVKPNIDNYNIKLDSASPIITTPWDSYEKYIPGRTSVDIDVVEENRGSEQSPLTLTYFWKYTNSSNLIVEETEKEILLSSAVEPVVDDTNTTYTVKIDIPNGSTIPPYQDFWLYAEVNDEARNMYSNRFVYAKVNQKDISPPVIAWDKSIREDGTEVNLNVEEDTGYTKSRTVSFNANDLESGVEEVKYLWTKEPYNAGSDSISQMVLSREDGKYVIHGTSLDTPLEGVYYLNLLVTNGTGVSVVSSKAFYFDNEGPHASGGVIYTDGNPTSVHYQVNDRVLQNKFLYTLLLGSDSFLSGFEPVIEPDISAGIKDDGMWKVLELEGVGEERTANIIGVLDKITQSGEYMLVTRYYDEYNNYTEVEENMWYDFIPPTLEVIYAGEPGAFQKNHDVVLKVLGGAIISINWIDADSGVEIPASYDIEPQLQWISIKGSEDFNGKYYLEVKAVDGSNNTMEETIFINGNRAEFSFDNSPPKVNLVYDNQKAVRTLQFSYSELGDAYTGVALFKYGISNTPEGVPSAWIDIDPASDFGEIVYPIELTADGELYLSVLLQDTQGNEQIIRQSEPFHIHVTNPTGSIGFVSGYTNKIEVPLQLEIAELIDTERKTFKTILSSDRTVLEDAAIAGVQPTDWKDITFEKGLAVYNWKLSDTIDGEQRVYSRFMDESGNLSAIYDASIILDRTAPTGEITYDITTPTSGNVKANLTMTDNYNVALLNNNQISSYVFNRNGEFEFILTDEAGNKTRSKAVVNNIDKTPPKATVTYSLTRDVWTNQSITATLELVDENDFSILSEGGSTHTFDENGEFIFYFEDILGNQGSIKAEVMSIDKTAPEGSIIYTYSDTAPVTVYLSVNEAAKVTNNNGSFRYVFNGNGEFTFEFEDKAGNIASATAMVDTITSTEKYVDVIYSDSGKLTKEDISAEFVTFSDLAIITNPTVMEEVVQYNHSFIENGEWPISIRVLSGTEEGSIRLVKGNVQNIDRVSPGAEAYITTKEPTNLNVTTTLLAYDDRGKTVTIENNGGESEYIFEENGEFTFDFMDEAGNVGHKTITVSNIDKSTPVAEIKYESKENSVIAAISFPGETEVEILNNNGSNIFEFVENGAYTFKYVDKAGNEGYAAAEATSLPGSILAGTIEYYIEGNKVDDPNEVITNKSVTAKLVLNEAGGPYTIVNNGGSSNYTFEQNGEFTFVYEDGNKNRGFETAKVSMIDKETPKLQIIADTVRVTNKDVAITVSYSDINGISKVTLNGEAVGTTPEGKFTYLCNENKTIQVSVFDTAGNVSTKEFDVNYIDKEIPIGTIVYTPNSITNQDVKAVLTLNESGLILNNSGMMEYVFTQNGDFTFEFEDSAGNKTTKKASVDWIDKVTPEVSLEYSNMLITNQPVEVTVKANEEMIILSNGGAATRKFYTNGEFTFRVIDLAGNEVSIKAEVWNIDTERPQITLNGLSYISLFQGEAYTEPGYSAVDNVGGDMTSNVVIEESVNIEVPGIYILKYKVSDAVGNSSEKTRTVKVIGLDEIVFLLNGDVSERESVILYSSNVKVSGIGNEGSYIIKWAEGKRTQAYFKTEGNDIAAEGTVKLVTDSWYTFFIQDRERKTKNIQVYINE